MSDLDDLMDKDPLEMTPSDIDTIIAYHRERRAKLIAEGNARAAKKEEGPKLKISLADLGKLAPKKVEGIRRRLGPTND